MNREVAFVAQKDVTPAKLRTWGKIPDSLARYILAMLARINTENIGAEAFVAVNWRKCLLETACSCYRKQLLLGGS